VIEAGKLPIGARPLGRRPPEHEVEVVEAPRNIRSVPSSPLVEPPSVPTRDERNDFLKLVAEGYSVRRAAAELAVPRQAFQDLLDADVQFREAYEGAFEAAADALEDEAWRRAHERGRYRASGDKLLLESLRARRPDRYSERVQVTGKGGGPIATVAVHVDHAAVLDVLHEAGLVAPGRLTSGG